MDDLLQKIDTIKQRTGATYREAKEALEQSGGDVLEAIISLEEKGSKNTWTEQFTIAGTDVIEKLREIIRVGNVNRIKVKKGDDIILDIPVTAGAVGAVLLPYITAIGAAVAFVSKCTIEIERPYKNDIHVNDEVNDMVKMAEKKAKEYFDADKEK